MELIVCIGPGDSGKSSILDAIDYCLGARRNLLIADTDFHLLDVNNPINITIALGKLDDSEHRRLRALPQGI